MPPEISVEQSHVGPVLHPADDNGTVLLYLGGDPGGSERGFAVAERLALRTGCTVVCLRYRSSFPGALIDAHSGYSYSQAEGPVAVVGERLGAALAIAMLVQLRDSEATLPHCAILLSALLDLTLETRSLQFNPEFDVAELRQRIKTYARATPLTDSRLSPLYANLHSLPPVQLLVTGTDPLLDDSLAFATRAARSRVPVDLHVYPETADFHADAGPAIAEFLRAKAPAPA